MLGHDRCSDERVLRSPPPRDRDPMDRPP